MARDVGREEALPEPGETAVIHLVALQFLRNRCHFLVQPAGLEEFRHLLHAGVFLLRVHHPRTFRQQDVLELLVLKQLGFKTLHCCVAGPLRIHLLDLREFGHDVPCERVGV